MGEPAVSKVLILAAGIGKRQRVNGVSKPLVPLLGLSLIGRVILTAKRAGVQEFRIIIGYQGEKIRKRLGDGRAYGVKIDYIYNDEWEKGNGVSVLKARDGIDEPFILLMADHLFDENILTRLREVSLDGNECVLCVDKNGHRYLDLEDATKLIVEDGKIKEIGKWLRSYNGIDTGIFLCTPAIFDALEKSIQDGNDSLSGGVRILAEKGKMSVLNVSDSFWIDVDDDRALKNAETLLCEQLKKDSDGPVSRHLNRPISIFVSKWLVKSRVTPLQLSLLSFAVGAVSAIFFAFGKYPALVIGGVLAQLASIIDGCDGEVARLKLVSSRYGGWFDSVLDRYVDALIILGIVWGHWILNGDVSIWVAGFLALVGSFVNSYTADKYDGFLKRSIRAGRKRVRMGRDVRLLLIFLGALANQVFATLVVLALLTNIESVRRMVLLRRADV